MVTRVFVEKRKGFDVEARHMMADLRQNLGLKAIEDLRILNRYDVSGLSGEEFEAAARTILSEPNVDNVYDENYKISSEYHVFATEFLPGQYDQRADSASQCVQLLTQGERPQVAYAKVIAVKGDLSEEEMEKIKNYIVNPVESRLASMEKPETLDMKIDVPADVKRVTGMISWSDEELRKYYGTMGFAMTFEDLAFCRDYFRDEEHRDPSVTELRVIDTYWSDHCRHTTFLTRLNNIEIEKGKLSGAIEKALGEYFAAREELYKGKDKPVSLMDMAVIGAKYLKKHGMVDDLDESDEINACSIEVPVTIDGKTEQWLVQFKNETHNHPTEIEPFGGAATCLGGAIRDPLSGRAYVYQAMRVTGSGDPTVPFKDTMKGKLPTATRSALRPVRSRSFMTPVMLQSAWRSARSSAHLRKRTSNASSRSPAISLCCSAAQRAVTAAAAQRVPPRRIRSNPSRFAAQRCRRATRRPNAKFSVCSVTRRFPRSSSAATTSARAACASPSASLHRALRLI